MSHSHTSQPEKHGAGHHADAPQVAVRDGNRLLCPCCGQVLMVLKQKRFTPPKMHHQQGDPRRTWPALERLIAEQEAHYENASTQEVPEEEPHQADHNQEGPAYRADSLVVPIDTKIAAYAFPPVDPPKIDQPVKLPSARPPEVALRHQPPRDWNTQYDANQRRRRQQPLQDPFTEEGARLFAWAYYRLQRLAVRIEKEIATKQIEIDRLQAKLSGGQKKETHQQPTEKPMNTNQQNEKKNIKPQRYDRPLPGNTPHAQADLGVAPGIVEGSHIVRSGDGQPRHAHEDVSMAPAEVTKASVNGAKHRGPP